MSYGLKAYSTTSSSVVIDDSFSSWQSVQTGTLSSSGILTSLSQTFQQNSASAPALFVKFSSSGTYYVPASTFDVSGTTVNQFAVFDGSSVGLGNSVSGLQYRFYKQLNLTTQNVLSGYGVNVFDGSANPVFSSNVNPLILDAYGLLDSGFNTLTGGSGFVGAEYNTGLFEPFVLVSYSQKSTRVVAGTGRLTFNLMPVFYHSNGTLRIRFYIAQQFVPIALPVYTFKAYGSNNIIQPMFCFNGSRPA
jgi:hypothetical protein